MRETGGREGGREGGKEGRREEEREEKERERLVTREPFIISYCTTEYCCIKINTSYCLNQTVIKVRVERCINASKHSSSDIKYMNSLISQSFCY